MNTVHSSSSSVALQRTWTVLALGALTGAMALTAAHAAPAPQAEITVQAAGRISEAQVGTTYSHEPIEQIQLTRRIIYRDLNLNTPAGVAQLRHRIRLTARAACAELTGLYPRMSPLGVWQGSKQQCVDEAVKGAMAQMPAAVAAAESSHTARRE